MMSRFLFVSLALFSLSADVNSQSIDAKNSMVTFSVSNMRFRTVEGTFKGMNGNVNFNPNNPNNSSFEVCIDASTVNTNNTKRDQHLKTEDFFAVDTYPNICFTSSQITKTASGYNTKGVLTMHGVSKNIEIPFTFSDNSLVGNFKVNRLDYKVGEGTGSFMVGTEIDIKITTYLE